MPSLRTLPADLRLFAKYHLVRRVVDHPARENELGLVELPFDADAHRDAIGKFAGFVVEEAGRVEYAGRAHAISVVSSKDRDAKRCLLVLAGVHGNERAGLLAVPEILAGFEARRPAGVRLVVVTPVNPVGAAELSRYNAQGYDINRDFIRFDTVEARVVRDVVERERPDFIVSLHEGPQDATFMFTNRHVDAELATALLGRVEAGGTVLAERDYFGRRLSPPGWAPSSRTLRVFNRLWAATLGMMATGAYAEGRGIPEITLESSWRQAEREVRVRPHVDLVAAVADSLVPSA